MVRTKEEYNEYMRDYMKRRYYKLRSEAYELLGGKCVKCGETDNLEIDHIDRTTKTVDVSKFCSMSRAKFMEELKLCQLLCHEHHKQKTSAEQSVEHGGGLTGKKNCRCDLCKPLKNAYSRQLKRNKRKRVSSSMEETPAS